MIRIGFDALALRAAVSIALFAASAGANAQTCAGQAPPAHTNGLGQAYFSCSPLGTPGNQATYNAALAQAARNSWPQMSNGDYDGVCGTSRGGGTSLAPASRAWRMSGRLRTEAN